MTRLRFRRESLLAPCLVRIIHYDCIAMGLEVNRDAIGVVFNAFRVIRTKHSQTEVLVSCGEAIVLVAAFQTVVTEAWPKTDSSQSVPCG